MLTHEVARRLEQKLGLGQFPLVRRRLFSRVQRICEQKGDGALLIVAGVLEEALGPKIRDKGQYFCWVCKRRLEENGYWDPPTAGPNEPRPGGPPVKSLVAVIGQPVGPAVQPAAEALQRELDRQRVENLKLRQQLEKVGKEGAW